MNLTREYGKYGIKIRLIPTQRERSSTSAFPFLLPWAWGKEWVSGTADTWRDGQSDWACSAVSVHTSDNSHDEALPLASRRFEYEGPPPHATQARGETDRTGR